MIASAGDVPTERQAARDVLRDWNVVHSEDKAIVLMPIGWDTHVTPEIGGRPQAIINKQILQGCDVLVAIFWTRLGSPTGVSASGTVEEIEEHLQAGKPAMIYFSDAPVRLDSVDEAQYQLLRESEMAANQLAQHPTTATQMSLEAIASGSMNRWLNFLWQEGAFKKDAGDVVYPSDELPSTGVIENPCEASSRLCLRLQLPRVAQYSARDWLEMSKDITTVNEDMAWVMWTKRPKATGIRRWDIIGEQAQKLRILLERAGQMLKKSSISNDLSIRLLLEIDPLKRWCEYVSGGGDLRIDGEGYDPDPDSESRIEYSSGRLLNAVKKSEEMCSAIVVKLT